MRQQQTNAEQQYTRAKITCCSDRPSHGHVHRRSLSADEHRIISPLVITHFYPASTTSACSSADVNATSKSPIGSGPETCTFPKWRARAALNCATTFLSARVRTRVERRGVGPGPSSARRMLGYPINADTQKKQLISRKNFEKTGDRQLQVGK